MKYKKKYPVSPQRCLSMAFTLPRSIHQSRFCNRPCNWHIKNYGSDPGKI